MRMPRTGVTPCTAPRTTLSRFKISDQRCARLDLKPRLLGHTCLVGSMFQLHFHIYYLFVDSNLDYLMYVAVFPRYWHGVARCWVHYPRLRAYLQCYMHLVQILSIIKIIFRNQLYFDTFRIQCFM
jgi:hypothetical protein